MYDKQNLTKDVIAMLWIASLMIIGLILIIVTINNKQNLSYHK